VALDEESVAPMGNKILNEGRDRTALHSSNVARTVRELLYEYSVCCSVPARGDISKVALCRSERANQRAAEALFSSHRAVYAAPMFPQQNKELSYMVSPICERTNAS
jgi:hypothetical protein